MPDDSGQCDSPTRREHLQDGRVYARRARRQGPVFDRSRQKPTAERSFDRQRVADVLDGDRGA